MSKARAVSVLLLGVSTSAFAFELLGGSWGWQPAPVFDPFHLDADSFPTSVATADEWEATFETALGTWSTTSGAEVALTYGGRAPASVTADGVLTAGYVEGSNPYVPAAVAVAYSWYLNGAAPGTPLAQSDCDIQFYSENQFGPVGWHVGGNSPVAVDFQEVATHEVGHCLGLDHTAVSDAIMWPYAHNRRALHGDDQAGVQSIYGETCADGDGDGYACDDCDDGDGAVHPYASETCNGIDDDCDGAVDGAFPTEVAFGGDTQVVSGLGVGLGAVYTPQHDLVLEAFEQELTFAGDVRVEFVVYEAPTPTSDFTLLRSAILDSGPFSGPLASPTLDVPLRAGRTYIVGAIGEGDVDYLYKGDTSPPTSGGLVQLGSAWVYVAPAEAILAPEIDPYPPAQLLHLRAVDVDGDGITDVCGDCADDDELRAPGVAEACDGVDNDCSGVADDGLPDADSDGLADCVDPCPADVSDDADGDGACADTDPCPDDPQDACEGGTGDTDTGSGKDLGTLCGCATGAGSAPLFVVLLAAVGRRRRG